MEQTFAKRLTDSLVALQHITKQEAQSILHLFHERSKSRLDYFLLDEGIVRKDDLLEALADVYGVQSFDVRGYFFQHDLLTLFPKEFLLSDVCIPAYIENDILHLVVCDPEDEDIISIAGQYVSYSLVLHVGIGRDIIDAVEEYYDEAYTTEALELEREQEHDDFEAESDEFADL